MLLALTFMCVLAVQSAAFRFGFLPSSRRQSPSGQCLWAKNTIDSVPIDGELLPISNNLLIRVKEMQSKTQSGLFLPDNVKERPTEGVVVGAGPGRVHPDTGVLIETTIKAGESVLYGKYDGTELKYNNVNHQMIKDDDVLLRFHGEELTLENAFPVKDQVLIRLLPKQETTAAGIVVTTSASESTRPTVGVVVKVGPGRQANNGQNMPLQVAPGDGVKFREYGGNPVKIEGKDYMVVRGYDIVAKFQYLA